MKRLSLITLSLAVVLAAPAFAQTITIGFTMSKTGALNVDSLEQSRGFELWRDQVNAAGGIKAGGKSYQVKLVTYDDESNSKRVQQLYTRLILEDKSDFLFSPYSSGLTTNASIVTEQNGKVMLTTGAADEKTYKLGNKLLFQMFAPGGEYLKGALDAVKVKDPKAAIAFVYEDAAFSVAVVKPAMAYAQQIGLNVAFSEAYAPATTDFSAILDKVISSKATVLMGGGHYPDGSTLARQLSARKASLKMITLLVAPDSPQWTELGEAGYGVSVPSQWEPQVMSKPQFGPSVTQFVKDYEAKFKAEASYESAGGYAAGLVLQHAIEQAGSLDSDKVAAVLNSMDVTTFYGRTKFSAAAADHGLQVGHTMVIAQWQKDKSGKLVKQVVWPAASKSADLKYPIY
ncbi:MAG TPA: amino acid ABC transporter substrate-binding protein [Terriglobales bacterium]|nr:amino acid ABC transporter substrate-binding protein [Terriglobales bacterium]